MLKGKLLHLNSSDHTQLERHVCGDKRLLYYLDQFALNESKASF